MKTLSLGRLRAHLTGGTDREGGGDGPVVVLMHGFGAPGDDLVPLWRVLPVPRETRFIFPEGLVSLPPAFGWGRAWWMIDVEALERAITTGEPREMHTSLPAGLEPAREAVLELLDAADRELGLKGAPLVLGGFSQGAMLALDVAMRVERELAGLVLLSGTLLGEGDWVPRMPRLAGLPVLQSHGRQDELLPFAMAERLHDELSAAGLQVTFIPFNGGHEIPPIVLNGLGELLGRVLPGS